MRWIAIGLTVIIGAPCAVVALRDPASPALPAVPGPDATAPASPVDAARLDPPSPAVPVSQAAEGPRPARPTIAWRREAFGAPGAAVIQTPSEAIAFIERIRCSRLSSYQPLLDGEAIESLPACDGGVVLAIAIGCGWQMAFASADGSGIVTEECLDNTAARERWLDDHAAELAAAWDDRHAATLAWVNRNYRSLKTDYFRNVPGETMAMSAQPGEHGWEISGTTSRSEHGATGWRMTLANDGSIVELTNWRACGGGRRCTIVRMPKAIN